MRKANRAITDFEEIKTLIDKCDTIRLGFVDGQEAYIVPLSFGYESENGEFTFYVHGAKVGRRHVLAAQNRRGCVVADPCLRFDEMGCPEAVINATCVEKIVVREFSAKQRFK